MEPQQPPVNKTEPIVTPVAEPPQQIASTQPVSSVMAQQPQAQIMSNPQPLPEKHSDGIGVASLITSIIGLHLVGLILGLIGSKKAKQAGRKSLMSTIGWIWGLVGMIIGLAVAGYLVYSYITLGSVNKKFLNAALDKDYDVACALWDSNSNESDTANCKKFIDGFAQDYKSYKVTSTEKVKEAIRTKVTYTKKDDSTDKGYVDVEKGSVTNFIFGVGASSSSAPEADNNEVTAPTTLAQQSLATCLEQADYAQLNYDGEPSSVKYDNYFSVEKNTFNYTDNTFFLPDSLDYESNPSIVQDTLDRFASFTTKHPTMPFKFRIEGSLYSPNQTNLKASKEFADKRPQKIKAGLISAGVPADRIVVDEPHDYTNDPQNYINKAIYRKVQILVDPTCPGRAPSDVIGDQI